MDFIVIVAFCTIFSVVDIFNNRRLTNEMAEESALLRLQMDQIEIQIAEQKRKIEEQNREIEKLTSKVNKMNKP